MVDIVVWWYFQPAKLKLNHVNRSYETIFLLSVHMKSKIKISILKIISIDQNEKCISSKIERSKNNVTLPGVQVAQTFVVTAASATDPGSQTAFLHCKDTEIYMHKRR